VWSGNSRLDTLQAAVLLVKLKYVETWTEKRRANAAFYQRALTEIPDLNVPIDQPFEKAVYHTFVIQVDRRDDLKQHLAENNVETAIHYPIPIHLQRVADSLMYELGSFPVAEKQAQRILSLPVYPELLENELQYIVDSIRRFYQEK
jgi:dTDP-4-amino-4,6-dideoxygalactose transaminase